MNHDYSKSAIPHTVSLISHTFLHLYKKQMIAEGNIKMHIRHEQLKSNVYGALSYKRHRNWFTHRGPADLHIYH